MPLVLMQRAWRDDPKYKDTEFVVYHYPRQYFDQILGGEKFVYYRPARDAKVGEASAYFGCGELGDWWTDPGDPTHRFVGVRKPSQFRNSCAAPLIGKTECTNRPLRAVMLSEGDLCATLTTWIYHRILDAAGLTGSGVARCSNG